eukprot:TRINITY_DN8324_c0_g1_i4.p1 TRINITY_DN8324_c0_g1~~TRINITY_DN8324_c0_g1_i4.p1  ORF type:complete len:320 (+),score=51.70 TRINITY_DN8324_c0_g1_i4:149-1108(+)
MSSNHHLLGNSPVHFLKFSALLSRSSGHSRSFSQSKKTALIVSFGKRHESHGKHAIRLLRNTPPFKRTTDFVRFHKGEELQTAIVSYRKPFSWSLQPSFQVDLVAAIHIGEKEYYSSLQKLLASYDRVLYEMITEKDDELQKSGSTVHWMPPEQAEEEESDMGFLLQLLAKIANLDFQIQCLDYRQDNWYHADLDYQTFIKLEQEKDEHLFKIAWDMTTDASTSKYQLKDHKDENMSEGNETWKMKILRISRYFPKPLVFSFLLEYICANSIASIAESPEMKAFFHLDLAGVTKVFLAKMVVLEWGKEQGCHGGVAESP